MYRKYHHFLHKYSDKEWSGPAWYSIQKDEHGFPEYVQLEYFHVLDLGTKTATDWDGKDLMKIYPKLSKQFPKIGNEWIQGNIHSHNDMGAFFSGTDKQQLIDGSNKNFYFSLVVSYKEGKELAFAVSYPDQYNQTIIQPINDIEEEKFEFSDDYKEEEQAIKQTERRIPSYAALTNTQRSLFSLIDTEDEEQEDVDAWNASFGVTDEVTSLPSFDDLQVAFMQGQITRQTFKESCNMIGVDTYGRKIK